MQIAFRAQSTCRIDAPRQIGSLDRTESDTVGTEQRLQFAGNRLLLHIAKRVSQSEFADDFRCIYLKTQQSSQFLGMNAENTLLTPSIGHRPQFRKIG